MFALVPGETAVMLGEMEVIPVSGLSYFIHIIKYYVQYELEHDRNTVTDCCLVVFLSVLCTTVTVCCLVVFLRVLLRTRLLSCSLSEGVVEDSN